MRFTKFSTLQNEAQSLKGKWKLSSGHELTYRERGQKKAASIKGTLVKAEPGALVVAVTVKEDEKRSSTGLVKLTGKWQLDSKNRITFFVKKPFTISEGGKKRTSWDKLTFQGMWEVDKNNEIVYFYETQEVLKGRGKARRKVRKTKHKLTFRGKWEISKKNSLAYTLAVDSESVFRVRGTFQTHNIHAKRKEIRYQIGIEYKAAHGRLKRVKQTIKLFGKWKVSRSLALSFKIQHSGNRKSVLRFGAQFELAKFKKNIPAFPDKVVVNLVSRTGRPLGIELILTKDFFKGDAQGFLRFRKSFKETAVEAGLTVAW